MSQPTNQEIEAKFAILDPALATHLCDTPSVTRAFRVENVKTVSHLDTYVDTSAYRLIRSGYALRVRQTADGFLMTLKSLPLTDKSPIQRRVELEASLLVHEAPLNLAHWPNQIREFVMALAGPDLELHPLCTLHQTRHKRLVAAKTPKSQAALPPFAELSIDEVALFLPGERSNADALPVIDPATPAILTFWEAEAELLPGQDVAQLESLADKLQRLRGLRPNGQSKLERALEAISGRLLVDETLVSDLQPEMHTADACRMIWQRQLMRMVLNEAGVRHSSDIEYVHDMRVAVRRARVAMQLFEPYFRRKRIRPFQRILRDTGRKLGAVRDLDVALEKMSKTQKKATAADPADFTMLISHWQQARSQAFAKLLAWLDSETYTDFLSDFAQFCRSAGKGVRRPRPHHDTALEPLEVRHVLPSMLIQRFEHVRAYETLFAQGEIPPVVTLHQLRIACKFLRYNLEFTQHLLGAPGARLIRNLKALQEHLGDLNDAAVSAQMIAALPDEVTNDELARYQQHQHTLIEELCAAVRPSLLDFVSLENRRLLMQAIVRI